MWEEVKYMIHIKVTVTVTLTSLGAHSFNDT